MRQRNRRATRPGLERMEGRELLSIVAALEASRPPVITAAQALSAHITQASNLPVYSGNSGTPPGNSFQGNSASPLLGNGTPAPHELVREAFHAGFQGISYTSPGRFSDQSTTYYYRGTGGSTDFLHGDFNMAIVTPADPSRPFLGEAVMNDKNTASSGILGLVLTADRTSVDSLGRPTHLTFSSDPNIYSGAFSVSASQGTVDIKYGAKGQISAVFKGLVYTNGLTSPLVNMDFYARHNRPIRYHGPAAKPKP